MLLSSDLVTQAAFAAYADLPLIIVCVLDVDHGRILVLYAMPKAGEEVDTQKPDFVVLIEPLLIQIGQVIRLSSEHFCQLSIEFAERCRNC